MKLEPVLVFGVILIMGFLFGELAAKLKLPRITGYLVAGILLNPDMVHFVPREIVNHTTFITNVSLAFISFSVGGTLLYSTIKKLGGGILAITFFEAQLAFLAVLLGTVLIAPLFLHEQGATLTNFFIPMGLMLASVASATDPSPALAISHEYKAKGEVTSTILSVSAFDDVLGIINFSFALVFATVLVLHEKFNLSTSIMKPLGIILGSVVIGIIFGYILNKLSYSIRNEKEGILYVVMFGLLLLCYGASNFFQFDELLSTMVMGAVVVNYNFAKEKMFDIIARHLEEIIMVVFFVISGMQMDFSTMSTAGGLILLVLVFRTLGKVGGSYFGAVLAKSSDAVRKYTAGGLIPQGGIIIGLALIAKETPEFAKFGSLVLNVTIGATVIHELVGPVLTKMSLKKAGEI